MGEKDCYESGGIRLAQPQIYARRIGNPFSERFTAADLSTVLAGGTPGVAKLNDLGLEPSTKLRDAIQQAGQALGGAPSSDPVAQVSAMNQAADVLGSGVDESQVQLDKFGSVVQVAGHAGTYAPQQVRNIVRESRRALEDAVGGDSLSVFRRVADEMRSRTEDAGVEYACTRLEAVAARAKAFASSTADRFLRGEERSVAAELPEPGSAA